MRNGTHNEELHQGARVSWLDHNCCVCEGTVVGTHNEYSKETNYVIRMDSGQYIEANIDSLKLIRL